MTNILRVKLFSNYREIGNTRSAHNIDVNVTFESPPSSEVRIDRSDQYRLVYDWITGTYMSVNTPPEDYETRRARLAAERQKEHEEYLKRRKLTLELEKDWFYVWEKVTAGLDLNQSRLDRQRGIMTFISDHFYEDAASIVVEAISRAQKLLADKNYEISTEVLTNNYSKCQLILRVVRKTE